MRIPILLSFVVLLALSRVSAQENVIIMEDSLYRIENPNSASREISSAKEVMERETIARQFRIFLHDKKAKFSDKDLDCTLSLNFYMNSRNEVTAATYDFSKMSFVDGKMIRHKFTSAEKDSLALILNLPDLLEEFAPKMIFKRKYLGDHVQYLYFSLRKVSDGPPQKNKLEELLANAQPDTIKTINLTGMELTEVPWKQLLRFKNAEKLNLNDNKLDAFPKQVLKLKKLKSIDISGNYLNQYNTFFKRHRRLEVLNIQNNGFTSLPKSLKKLKKVNNLVIGNNSLYDIQEYKFHKHKKLKDLNFYNLNLEEVPAAVFKMKRLETLDLYFNNVNYFPAELANLKSLKVLAVSYNDMWSLPSVVNQLPELKIIYAHHNQLDRLPDLPASLEELDIGYNQYKVFPNNIAKLGSLKLIDYSNNDLTDGISTDLLPPKLESLFIRNNPFFHDERYEKQAKSFIEKLKGMGVIVK
ncbi:hypothetical protein SAMN06298216_4002 [Spirosomataceae bacterium TFI 002]|nr:hypothetical protein SAMN06298216_4002 [Spirosomataceae bacterium TFI 002]